MWKEVKGYEELYEVSSDGKLRDKNSLNFQKAYLNKTSGYFNFSLYKNGVQEMFLVHRLVALHFIPKSSEYTQVNHIDEDKTNNHMDNLEWCTPKYNANYGTRLARCNGVRRNNTKNTKPVIAIHLVTNEKLTFPSANEAGRNGFDKSNVINCCNGKRYKSHKGYKWIWA